MVPIPGTGTSLAIVGYPVGAGRLLSRRPGTQAVRGRPCRRGARRLGAAGAPRPARGQAFRAAARSRTAAGLVDGAEVTLTFQEFELLAFLAAHPATVFSRADLVQKVWQRDFTADSRTVDVHVSRLRRKLGPAYGKCLVTEYRVGYQFRPSPAEPPAHRKTVDVWAALVCPNVQYPVYAGGFSR